MLVLANFGFYSPYSVAISYSGYFWGFRSAEVETVCLFVMIDLPVASVRSSWFFILAYQISR